jgi:hypothetical protein
VSIVDSHFWNNVGGMGGALYVEDMDVAITDTDFVGNEAAEGGAFYFMHMSTQPRVQNSTFTDNRAQIGGAYRSVGMEPWFTDSTFVGNHATQFGNDGFVFATRLVVVDIGLKYSGGVAPDILVQLSDDEGGIITQPSDADMGWCIMTLAALNTLGVA